MLLTGSALTTTVTTKHEKRFHADHLFAVSYGSFLREAFSQDCAFASSFSASMSAINLRSQSYKSPEVPGRESYPTPTFSTPTGDYTNYEPRGRLI